MIWLIGNRGMLGSDVETLLAKEGCRRIVSDREVDICDVSALRSFAAGKNVKWIINCSAYTAVDKAEDEEKIAYAINADGVRNIALIAKENNARLIHISTDYVFDGASSGAYGENDPTGPQGVYGKSKLAGEERIRETLKEHYIVRTAWLYGLRGSNFVYTMLRLFNERGEVRVVNDQTGSPTFTLDLAGAILAMVKNTPPSGTYHYANEGRTTWYEFACAIRDIARRKNMLARDVQLIPISTSEYPTRARRPANSLLSKEKIRKNLGIEIRDWPSALEAFMAVVAEERSKQ